MRSIKIYFLLLFLPGFSLEITNDLTEQAYKLALLGIYETYQGGHEQCQQTLYKLKKLLPEHPVGYLFSAAAFQIAVIDYRNFPLIKKFEENIEKAIGLSKKLIKRDKRDPWGYFYLGASYGFRGLIRVEYGNFFSAAFDGLKGYKNMQKALERKEDLYDAYYGIGLYHYWTSAYADKLYVILGSKSERREQGISELRISVDKGSYTPVEALCSLVRIFHNEKKYHQALVEAFKIKEKYPRCVYSYWYMASCYQELGDFAKMIEIYKELKAILDLSPLASQVARMEIAYFMGLGHWKLGHSQEAREHIRGIVDLEREEGQHKKRFDQYKKLSIKLLKKIEKNSKNF